MAVNSSVRADSAKPDSYDPAYFAPLFAIEDRHFWFRTRNTIIAALADQLTTALPSGYRVLEVGCGTGNVLRALKQTCRRGIVIGMDLFAEGLHYAQQRSDAQLLQGDMRAPPFAAQFEVIGLFDVLEHLPDDRQVLTDLHKMLAPGGALLLTVPAHMSLWSYFDEASHHVRRYAVTELEDKLIATGYEIKFISQYMATLFPIVWLWRRVAACLDHRPPSTPFRADELAYNELRILPIVNGWMALVLQLEAIILNRRRPLPFGTSLIAVARKVA